MATTTKPVAPKKSVVTKKTTVKSVSAKKTAPVTRAPAAKVAAPKIEATAPIKPVLSKHLHKNLKVSPRKLRLVVAAVKSLSPEVALTRLRFTNTNAARLLRKEIETAIASAKNNYHLLPASLKFVEMRVDEGMKIKRMDKGHGSRFARGIIQKRHSRLIVVLSGTIQS